MPRTVTPFIPLQRIFKTKEQLRNFKQTTSRGNMVHASHIEALEKAGCKDWELCNYAASYVLMIAKPLGLLQELDKALGLSLRQLRQLKRSTLNLADTYERLFNAPLVPTDMPILLRGSKCFSSLWSLPQLLRLAAGRVENWPDAEYRRWLSDRNLRTYFLAVLCVHISTLTGRPHYEEIASLLTEVARWLNFSLAFDSEKVRKDFEAFRRRNKESMSAMRMWAQCHRVAKDNPGMTFQTRPQPY
jgi:hypothetical protein